MFKLVLFILYLLTGLLMGLSYAVLSGNPSIFVDVGSIGPLVAVALGVLWWSRPIFAVIDKGIGTRSTRILPMALTYVAYLCAPIVLNGAAFALRTVGYSEEAKTVFAVRFWGLHGAPFLGVTAAFVAVTFMVVFVTPSWRRGKSGSGRIPPPSGLIDSGLADASSSTSDSGVLKIVLT